MESIKKEEKNVRNPGLLQSILMHTNIYSYIFILKRPPRWSSGQHV